MIRVVDLETWLRANGLDAAVTVYPGAFLTVDGQPVGGLKDRALFISATGGPGLLLEQLFDVPTYQFRIRSSQGNAGEAYTAAEADAKLLDDLIVTAPFPTTIGGRHVTRIGRVGGPPAYLLSERRRAHFTANYFFEIATT